MRDIKPGMEALARLVEAHAPSDGLHLTCIPNLMTFRESAPHTLKPQLYEPCIVFVARGKKQVLLEGTTYDYEPGHFLAVLAPMPVQCRVVSASSAEPLLGATVLLDRQRILKVLMKMDQAGPTPARPGPIDPSGIFSAPLSERLLDAVVRLVATLDDPAEAAIVGEAVVDEIYFRLLKDERGGTLVHLLEQRGQIQQIARAVEHVHRNLSGQISVDELAALVHMSSSGFHKKFREVMHLSPIQYAKRTKLNRAQGYLWQGKSVSQAGFMVGYRSPAQFSREYKRHFGVSPSEDRAG